MKILTKEEEQAHYKYASIKFNISPRSMLMVVVKRSKVVLLVVQLG